MAVNIVRNKKSKHHEQNPQDTLSILLKTYEDTHQKSKDQIEMARDLIVETRIKADWHKKFIKTGDHKTEVEYAAFNAANYVESLTDHLSRTMDTIEKEKDIAKEFAISCFNYLNKLHEGTCIGEAGKMIVTLFKKGELCTEVMDILMGEAEKLSVDKSLPFANKLSESQKKALDFIAEEKEVRITPVIHSLQEYNNLASHIGRWAPLLQALVKEDTQKAQKLIDSMP
jgi:hypothetical protein